jgi:hypothetical protein
MKDAIDGLVRMRSLVSFWTFQEAPGSPRVAVGRHRYALNERGGVGGRADEGVFGNHSAMFDTKELTGPCLQIDRRDCPALNFAGPAARFTIVAWVKRRADPGFAHNCQALTGMWNEHGKRQYCLFLNLRIHDSAEQVCAHISHVGGPTAGYRYCMDAAIGATPVPFDRWQCVAISYDGQYARAYLNGKLDARGDRNPYHYPHGLFDGGENGADFTVGAVERPERVEMIDGRPIEHGTVQSNCFRGLLGGLAIFDQALDDDQLTTLASIIPSTHS